MGDVTEAAVVILLGALSWRYMNTLFAVTIFPRMPDDPGVRFAVVTLCRYAVLGLASLIALGAIHLDLAKIGVVLAALGVGLGFGLQEIVSNFVCGIILLLERPIRIGDVVTVAGNHREGRPHQHPRHDDHQLRQPEHDRSQSRVHHGQPGQLDAQGQDPAGADQDECRLRHRPRPGRRPPAADRAADADVMINPAPSAALEGFGESSLLFGLYTFVPEPGLAGDVRHRLCAEIQRRFTEEGIVIPYPTHELHVNNRALLVPPRAPESTRDDGHSAYPHRYDAATKTPPTPHVAGAQPGSGSKPEESARIGNDI